ncbi:glycerophosphodiester phosphodiesterase [Anaerophaga thermohalophila]|uniref:glycerophosphodiester phosphodiesterase n=1 Tax=Anaerophaga thermohalophila TaxID=177400 RepID=UPI0002D8F8F4|nr:glycerophosphodiester phosphodiesterase family protein [Anaerophaga thermohalophila]
MKQFSIALMVLTALSACRSNKLEVIAHRGASGSETENTIEAVEKAVELGSDAIEVDIWRTKDDSLVVFHDRNTARLSVDSLVVPESEYKALRELSIGGNTKIPTLREILEILPSDVRLFIEIKCCWEEGEAGNVFPMLSDLLQGTGKTNQTVIISFNPAKLKEASDYLPKVPLYWLVWEKKPVDELIKTALEYDADGLNVHFNVLSEELMKKAKQNNLEVFVWTVNDEGKVAEIRHKYRGIEGITTDYPDLIKKRLKLNRR